MARRESSDRFLISKETRCDPISWTLIPNVIHLCVAFIIIIIINNDCVGRKINWELCRKYGLAASERWYEHQPETVTENDSYKLLWDFSIQTDHVIQARRPDVILIDKEKKECKIIDFAIPYDSRVNANVGMHPRD